MTAPAEIRDRLDIEPGDKLRWTLADDGTLRVEVVDCIVVAHVRRTGLEYVYSFDDDFDRFDGITRLATPTNPFDAR